MRDLQTWIAKRLPRQRWGHTVCVYDERYIPEHVAAALFNERQQLVRKLAKERSRRRQAEHKLHERGSTIAECNVLVKSWRNRAIAHGYTDEYVERDRTRGVEGKAGDDGGKGVEAPNRCKLTECQGRPRCEKCLTMDRAYGVDVPAPAQPWLTPLEVEILREIRLHAKFDGLNEGWQRNARNLLLGLERFYSRTAAKPERLELTDPEASALHRAEVVRDALLAYHARPCDKEAAAIMKAVASQFTTRVAPHGVAACEACNGTRGGVPGNENIVDGKRLCDYCHADHVRAPGIPALDNQTFSSSSTGGVESE